MSNLPGLGGFGGGLPGAGPQPNSAGMSEQEQQMIKTMNAVMESCAGKSVLSGGMGFALGGAFGLFMSSLSYDTPMTPQGQELSKLPVREQLRKGFKEMSSRSYSSAKNFGTIGALFAGSECCIEGYRGKHDLANGIAAGCVTGGILGAKAGPQAAAAGCVGFAAFSAAIDYYMNLPPSED
ncbi:MAG: Mitochondrial import inner membrane translocase subunit tim22 [Cirrosporium novae-zelandiae]|nr:MAG: Mitochondrial import inner membrane translocase subunit tim22 [Cirrosporium novae-zelandiae]